MSSPFPPVLTEDHYNQMQNALQLSQFLEQELVRAKNAGIDTTAYEQQLRDAKAKILQMKNAYFPGR